MVGFLCAVIYRNTPILLTRLLAFSLHEWALLRHFCHMRVHCTCQNGKSSVLASNQLANRKKK